MCALTWPASERAARAQLAPGYRAVECARTCCSQTHLAGGFRSSPPGSSNANWAFELFLRALAGSEVVPSLLPVDAVAPPVLDLLFRIHFSEPPARFILVPPLQRVAVRGQKRWREKEDPVRGSYRRRSAVRSVPRRPSPLVGTPRLILDVAGHFLRTPPIVLTL